MHLILSHSFNMTLLYIVFPYTTGHSDCNETGICTYLFQVHGKDKQSYINDLITPAISVHTFLPDRPCRAKQESV